VLGSWHPKWRAKNRGDWLLVQIITWEGGFYLFRSKKQETRDKKQETRKKILEARYESLNSTNFLLSIEYRMSIEEVEIREIVESRIATNMSNFLFLASCF
jgi:hypothetical protein